MYSPGPWKVVKAIDTWMVASCGDGLIIQSARCPSDALGSAEEDAELISAAPELLEFLKKHQKSLNNFFDGLEGPFSDSKRTLNDLIKKAGG